MKIQINKEAKIKLLGAIKSGYLDTADIPEFAAIFDTPHPFLNNAIKNGYIKYEDLPEYIRLRVDGSDPMKLTRMTLGINEPTKNNDYESND